MGPLGLKGAQILTNVNGEELSDLRFRPFLCQGGSAGCVPDDASEWVHARPALHPFLLQQRARQSTGYDGGAASVDFQRDAGGVSRPETDGGAWGRVLAGYSGRIDHAWGAREDAHGTLPLPPTHYLRQVYLDTIVFTPHQLRYMIDVFGPDRILMGTDYPFDMAEHDPIGHIASVQGMDDTMMKALSGGNAIKALGLDV